MNNANTTTKATETKAILFGDIIRMRVAGEDISDALVLKLAYAIRYGELTPGYDGCTMENIQAMAAAQRALSTRLIALETAAKATALAPVAPPVRAAWGSRGVRYDEPCSRCGRESTVDNATGRCKRCG